jgi:hypothetical protein
VEADSEDTVRATLGRDPWSGTHLVVDAVEPWTIRLDGRRRYPAGRTRTSEPSDPSACGPARGDLSGGPADEFGGVVPSESA